MLDLCADWMEVLFVVLVKCFAQTLVYLLSLLYHCFHKSLSTHRCQCILVEVDVWLCWAPVANYSIIRYADRNRLTLGSTLWTQDGSDPRGL